MDSSEKERTDNKRTVINRKKLRDSELKGIYLNEDLTRKRSKLMFEARKQVKAANRKILGHGRLMEKSLSRTFEKKFTESHLKVILTR